MHTVSTERASKRLIATCGWALGLAASFEAGAQEGPAGRIIGHVDGARSDAGGYHVWGWACQQGRPDSLVVHVYADDSASGVSRETFVLAGRANLDNEAAVDQACQDTHGHHHRFDIPAPGAALLVFHGKKIYVHGIRVAGAVENAAIAGSGPLVFTDAPRPRDTPASYPSLAGAYAEQLQHPRVFVSRVELEDIARRINKAGSFSAHRFAALAERVRSDLTASVD